MLRAVDNVSLTVQGNEVLGITGESGCGKSTLVAAILRILPKAGKITSGSIVFNGTNLSSLPETEMRKIRWKEISVIFQNAMNALDPVYRIKDLLREPLRIHETISEDEATKRITQSLDLVRISHTRMESYPHELSGGMKQRVMIAMALICKPQLVIADEFTTGLDVIVQDQILVEIEDLRKELGFSMILITHDLAIILETCDRVGVMYAGKIVEIGDRRCILQNPRHPYTRALLGSMPTIREAKRKLGSLSGSPPSMLNPPAGCRFMSRCVLATKLCEADPPNLEVGPMHYSRCHYALNKRLERMKFGLA